MASERIWTAGLLLAIAPEKAGMCLDVLKEFGFTETAIIGQVTAPKGTDAPVVFNR